MKRNNNNGGAKTALELDNVAIEFNRTCRVPATEEFTSSLPPGLGKFPIYKVADFPDSVPEDWKLEGHFIPMYFHEAMWMNFRVRPGAVVAMLIGAGMINAVTGDDLEAVLRNDPQNYIVCPSQPWLDGFMTEGKVKQFIASILGEGETVEEQLTGEAKFGGIQFAVFNPKINLIPENSPAQQITSGKFKPEFKPPHFMHHNEEDSGVRTYALKSATFGASGSFSKSINTRGGGAKAMGLGAGGLIRQKIYKDNYTIGSSIDEVWHKEPSHKAWVYIVDPIGFKVITGEDAPPSPITFQTYQEQGLPWFGLFDADKSGVESAGVFDKLKPVGEKESPLHKKDKIDKITEKLW